MNVVTRFPPSPTGYLHIGSLRTALYNYLYARHHGGRFILRVEDTDRERLIDGAVESLIRTMDTMGLDYDEGPTLDGEKGDSGPYTQSQRLDIYRPYADQLIKQGDAYVCFCSKERLTELRESQSKAKLQPKYDRHCLGLDPADVERRVAEKEPHVIRLAMPEGVIEFTDEIRGIIKIDAAQIDDQVLIKTDGFPTYHLAVVIDDHLMGVTHIIRGEEWISSVPKHVVLYEKLGFPRPAFAHLPLILNPDKSKLSKRQGDVAVEDYLAKGYLPEALNNFVALLGFNPTGDREIYTFQELVNSFDLKKVNKSGAVFDQEKLRWMNSQYIKALSGKQIVERVGDLGVSSDLLEKIATVEKDRLNTLDELSQRIHMYTQTPAYESEILVWKKSDAQDALTQLQGVQKVLTDLDEQSFTSVELIEGALKTYITSNELSNGNVLWPLRVALSGKERSPGPFELAWALGKQESLKRLESATARLT